MELKEKRNKAFDNFQLRLNDKTDAELSKMIVEMDKAYESSIDSMSWDEKRELMLSAEYNYIQQCQEADLDTLYLS